MKVGEQKRQHQVAPAEWATAFIGHGHGSKIDEADLAEDIISERSSDAGGLRDHH